MYKYIHMKTQQFRITSSSVYALAFMYFISPTQANYGGISVKVPKSLREIFTDEEPSEVEVEEEEEEEGKTEVEMNWNICKYLPEAASCQDIFRVS